MSPDFYYSIDTSALIHGWIGCGSGVANVSY